MPTLKKENFMTPSRITFLTGVIIFILAVVEMTTDLYVPVLPHLMTLFNTQASSVQLTISLHLLGLGLGQPIVGCLADSLGYRKALFIGLALFFVASLGCAVSQTIETLILFRLIQGFGACAVPVVGLAVIKELYHEESQQIKILSIMSMVIAMSPALGPIFGGYLFVLFGPRACFYGISMIIAAAMPVLFPLMRSLAAPAKTQKTNSKEMVKDYLRLFASFPFLSYSLANALLIAGIWIFIVKASFLFIQTYQVPSTHYGYYQAYVVSTFILGSFITHRLTNFWSQQRILIGGLIINCIGSASLVGVSTYLSPSPVLFTALLGIYSFGMSLFRPCALNLAMDFFPKQKGASSSVIGMLEMVLGSLAIYFLKESEPSLIQLAFPIALMSFISCLTLGAANLVPPDLRSSFLRLKRTFRPK